MGFNKTTQDIYIGNTDKTERWCFIYPNRQKQIPPDEVNAGDICAVSKLEGIQEAILLVTKELVLFIQQ